MSFSSSGPVATLPGHEVRCPASVMCDTDHGDNRLAVKRIQGETDSFGCEYIDMCQECYDVYLSEKDKPNAKKCHWCRFTKTDCKPTRDMDEGIAGPIYDVCLDCRVKQNERAREELDLDDVY